MDTNGKWKVGKLNYFLRTADERANLGLEPQTDTLPKLAVFAKSFERVSKSNILPKVTFFGTCFVRSGPGNFEEIHAPRGYPKIARSKTHIF